MARLTAINPEVATGKTKELFNAIQGKLGIIPNMTRTMANSPAFLESYLNLSGALAGGTLGSKTGELIALAVSESNACDYCLSAHTYISTNMVKIKPEVIEAARLGNASDAKIDGVLKLAKTLVSKKGLLADSDVEAAKVAGLSEGEIGEVVGHVALNILTNYFNNTAQTEIDFPVVTAHKLETV